MACVPKLLNRTPSMILRMLMQIISLRIRKDGGFRALNLNYTFRFTWDGVNECLEGVKMFVVLVNYHYY